MRSNDTSSHFVDLERKKHTNQVAQNSMTKTFFPISRSKLIGSPRSRNWTIQEIVQHFKKSYFSQKKIRNLDHRKTTLDVSQFTKRRSRDVCIHCDWQEWVKESKLTPKKFFYTVSDLLSHCSFDMCVDFVFIIWLVTSENMRISYKYFCVQDRLEFSVSASFSCVDSTLQLLSENIATFPIVWLSLSSSTSSSNRCEQTSSWSTVSYFINYKISTVFISRL